jgi:capsular polysaccharide transport system permease protein
MATDPDNVISLATGGPRGAAMPVAIGPAAKAARREAILARRARTAASPSVDRPSVDRPPMPDPSAPDDPAGQDPHGRSDPGPVTMPPAALPDEAQVAPKRQGIMAFPLLVLLPVAVVAWYLWSVAVDQYASRVGFSVRDDGTMSAAGLIGGMGALASLAGRGGQEADIVVAFLHSQEMVARLDRRLDLRGHLSAPHAADPVFALAPGATVEDLTALWGRMATVSHDPATGLVDLTVRAFDPGTAQAVSRAVLDESAALVDRLSDAARAEAMAHATADLARSEVRLASARAATARFRATHRLVDPMGEAAVQSGLVATLEAQLAEALIAQDLLVGTTRSDDPRLAQAARRIAVIEQRIGAERDRFAPGAGDDILTTATTTVAAAAVAAAGARAAAEAADDHVTRLAEYERLQVDQRFAETAYTAALAAVEAARTDAQRRTMHLVAHVEPTLAERAEYPRRWMILGITAAGALLTWLVLVLFVAALRDRA